MSNEIELKKQNAEILKVALVTWSSMFIMGYINAYALGTGHWLLGSMITAQTGNLVWMGKNLAQGDWFNLISNLALFLGFVSGNIFGFCTKGIIKHKTKQFFFSWTCFILPIIIFPVYMHFVEPVFAFLIMGFASGCGLSFFRQIYHLDVNNAMATGNVRFFGLWFYEAFVKKARTEKKEIFTFGLFSVCCLVFIFGSFLYSKTSKLGDSEIWNFYISEFVLMAICIIPYFFAPRDPDFVKPQGTYGGGINTKKGYGGGINTKK